MDTNEVVVVALSGGKDSTAMALRLAETEPGNNYHWVLTPTGNELPDMFEHWNGLRQMLADKGKFVPLMAEGLKRNIRRNNMLPNFRARFCTRQLKIEPYAAYMMALTKTFDRVVSCVGIRADEEEREAGDYSKIPDVVQRFPLREWGWGLSRVRSYLDQKGITIPRRTDCAWCFFQRLGEWYDLYLDYPDLYEEAVQLEEEFGHTFRSNTADTWPTDLKGLRERFAEGIVPRGASIQHDLFATEPQSNLKCRVCRL